MPKTHTVYHTKKYLEEDEQFTFPIHQNISGRNVIVGDISGTVTQKDNSKKTKSGKGKPNWLNILYWIIGILVGITILITFTKELIKI